MNKLRQEQRKRGEREIDNETENVDSKSEGEHI
jgi:hypothetical protein